MQNSAGKKSGEKPTSKGQILTWNRVISACRHACRQELLAIAHRRRALLYALRQIEILRGAQRPPVPLPPKRARSRSKPSGKKIGHYPPAARRIVSPAPCPAGLAGPKLKGLGGLERPKCLIGYLASGF